MNPNHYPFTRERPHSKSRYESIVEFVLAKSREGKYTVKEIAELLEKQDVEN